MQDNVRESTRRGGTLAMDLLKDEPGGDLGPGSGTRSDLPARTPNGSASKTDRDMMRGS